MSCKSSLFVSLSISWKLVFQNTCHRRRVRGCVLLSLSPDGLSWGICQWQKDWVETEARLQLHQEDWRLSWSHARTASAVHGSSCVHVPCTIAVHDWISLSVCAQLLERTCVCLYCICEREVRGQRSGGGQAMLRGIESRLSPTMESFKEKE